ncbi:hypothetical protein QA315_04560, partial [Glaesserella parasuis]|uniref:hypothetical protein n=1 Tax=Glaesserella parasuis TaxID=738 RepID=UPI002436A40F
RKRTGLRIVQWLRHWVISGGNATQLCLSDCDKVAVGVVKFCENTTACKNSIFVGISLPQRGNTMRNRRRKPAGLSPPHASVRGYA